MTSLRVGLIGYGFAGKTFHAPLIRATQGLTLSAVASRCPAKVLGDLGKVEVFTDPLAMIDGADLDVVIVASPNTTHVPLARAAIEAGLHVVVDKPFAPTLAEARVLVSLAQTYDVMLAAFHNRRWDSDFLAVRDIVRSAQIGRIVHFESRLDRYRPVVRNRWRERQLPASGLWYDLGPHLVDQSLLLFGLPDRISANFATQRDGAVVDDWAHVVLDYGGLRSILHCSLLATGTPRFVVHGTHGTAIKRTPDRQEEQLLAGMMPGSSGWGSDADPLLVIDQNGGRSEQVVSGDQRTFYVDVVAHLTGKALNPVPALQAIAVSAVLEAAALSANTGRTAELDLSDAEREAWTIVRPLAH